MLRVTGARLKKLRWPRVCALVPAVVSCFALTGCSQQPGPKGAAPAAAENSNARQVEARGADAAPASSTTETQLRVAAASDLQFALQELAARYEEKHPDAQVAVTFGSSGNLFAQLSNKAPFDMFLSADMSYPRKLIEAGLAAADSEFQYAVGRIVVWVPKDSPLDVERLGIQTLTDPTVKKVAIANPQHAPYGRVAEAAMKRLGVYDAVQERLVLGENISQTAQFVESGAAEVGIIALSLALAPALRDEGRYWPVPDDAYPRLEQGGIIMKNAQSPAAAEKFRAYITGDEGKALLREYGFEIPEN